MLMVRNLAITLAALAVAIFFSTCAYIALDANQKVIGPIEVALHGQHANGDDGYLVIAKLLMLNATGAANAVKQTAQDANRIAKSQEKPTQALTAASVDLLAESKTTIEKLGTTVDSVTATVADVRLTTLPKLGASVDTLNGLVGDLRPTAQALTGVVNESTNVVKSLNLVVSHADALVDDPAFRQIAANMSAMSASLNSASGHINGATDHAEKALGYVELDLSPRHEPLWRSLISEALSQAIGIPLKYLPSRVAVTGSVPLPVTPAPK